MTLHAIAVLAGCANNEAASPTRIADAAIDAANGDTCSSDTSPDAGLQSYSANAPEFLYVGRVDLSDPAGPWLIESGSYFVTTFRGSGAEVELNDSAIYGVDFFDVLVDDLPPFVLTPASGSSWYDISTFGDAGNSIALGCGVHTLTLVKRTEATVGTTQVLGVRAVGASPPPAASGPVHRIEFIGDSLLCGYGVEADSPDAEACTDNGLGQPGYGQGVEDGYKAFGVVTGRLLNAQWHITCESGVGLVRNTDNGYVDPRPMPEIYPLLHPESTTNPTLWPVTQWAAANGGPVVASPDVVVVELGGNDLSLGTADGGQRPAIAVGNPSDGPDGGPSLVAGFLAFLGQLAVDFPSATFVLAANAPNVQEAIDAVVGYYADAGAAGGPLKVYGYSDGLPFPGGGCDGHPNVQQQMQAGQRMAAYVRQIMNW